eukprot:s11491_g1.t1
MDVWKRPDGDIVRNWGSPNTGREVSSLLQKALLTDRWERIALQESADGTQEGIDWTVPRKLLKESAKKPLVQSGLRMLFQGAIRRANHGGDAIDWTVPRKLLKESAKKPLVQSGLRMLFQGAIRRANHGGDAFCHRCGIGGRHWAGSDLEGALSGSPGVLWCEGTCPQTVNAASGIDFLPNGSAKGRRFYRFGATVNDGESAALDQLAQWATGQIQVAADSKIAIRRCRVPDIESKHPAIWTAPQERRDLLQVSWTKGHLSLDGSNMAWTWAANLEADRECSSRSLEAFSADAAARTDSIDAAARAKCRWLGGRCAYILAHDPIPKVKDLKFEPVPVANKSVKKQGPNKRQQLLAALAAENPLTGHKSTLAL